MNQSIDSVFSSEEEKKLVEKYKDIWSQQAFTVSDDKKDKIALAYLTHIWGYPLSELKNAELYIGGSFYWKIKGEDLLKNIDEKEYLSSGILKKDNTEKDNYSEFWKIVENLFPNNYQKKELDWLIKRGKTDAIHELLHCLDKSSSNTVEELSSTSSVLHSVAWIK